MLHEKMGARKRARRAATVTGCEMGTRGVGRRRNREKTREEKRRRRRDDEKTTRIEIPRDTNRRAESAERVRGANVFGALRRARGDVGRRRGRGGRGRRRDDDDDDEHRTFHLEE